ncbi:MAG: hypothetical protein COV45_08835 [Deltaproteobacteria bacterium CG11_big_fil_rev_8_21_14_0_20_47_16]|nr:MAG: hypothetical protein COV45_08835 [Deltaproteobacteria bacterium CG11_big_fil_rev_8_21_14_0_20_47_16]
MSAVRICITSPQPGNDRLAAMLKNVGLDVWQMPVLEYAPPHDDYAALDHAINELSVYRYVVFTSPHAVTVFSDRLAAHGDAPIAHLQFAVVGEATAKLCAEMGFSVHHIPTKSTSQALGDLLRTQVPSGSKVLFPQVEAGRPEFVEAMAHSDANVTIVAAYSTQPTSLDVGYWKRQLNGSEWQGLVVTSPRGLRTFLDVFGHAWCHEVMEVRPLFVMGATTAQSADYLGFRHIQIPEHSTLESLSRCISEYF